MCRILVIVGDHEVGKKRFSAVYVNSLFPDDIAAPLPSTGSFNVCCVGINELAIKLAIGVNEENCEIY